MADVWNGAGEIVRIQPTICNGVEFVDCRAHTKNAAGEAGPTERGLTLSVEVWRDVLPLLMGAVAPAQAAASRN